MTFEYLNRSKRCILVHVHPDVMEPKYVADHSSIDLIPARWVLLHSNPLNGVSLILPKLQIPFHHPKLTTNANKEDL